MSSLVHRKEDQAHHAYYSSEIGLVDWISRNYHFSNEIQVASAYQNYGLLLLMRTNHKVEILPVQRKSSYQEAKELFPDKTIHHEVSGEYELHCKMETTITIDQIFLESIRRIRVFQESGGETYQQSIFEDIPTIDSYENQRDGMSIVLERNVFDTFYYRVNLFIQGAQLVIPGKSFTLSEGVHSIALNMSLAGKFSDEDYAPLAREPMDLLKINVRPQVLEMSPFLRKMASNQLEGLSLLSRNAKLFAGGPRFFTYFGRDTLISIAMLTGSVSQSFALHAFRSVIERLSLQGEVAHEEMVGEYATMIKRQELYSKRKPNAVPTSSGLLEYHMVDDDFLFPAVLAHWNEIEGTQGIESLLHESFETLDGIRRSGYELLGRTISYCFFRIQNGLVPYHSFCDVGDWRDSLSQQGIRYSYEVNIGLGQNFIAVIRTLATQLKHLKPFIPPLMLGKEGDSCSLVFRKETAPFTVHVQMKEIRERVTSWLEGAGFTGDEKAVLLNRLAQIPIDTGEYSFTAFGLDAQKQPIEVQHNDVAFTLLFGEPSLEELDTLLRPLETPFPLGLKTEVGILVSNAVFASQNHIALGLDRSHYHGLVVWPLMNSLLFHGIQHQMERLKLLNVSIQDERIGDYLHRFIKMKEYLNNLHEKLRDFNSSELWTFSPTESGDIPLAFGKEMGSSTESNPLQLWSCLGFTTLFD